MRLDEKHRKRRIAKDLANKRGLKVVAFHNKYIEAVWRVSVKKYVKKTKTKKTNKRIP
jgi:hypothetical protein